MLSAQQSPPRYLLTATTSRSIRRGRVNQNARVWYAKLAESGGMLVSFPVTTKKKRGARHPTESPWFYARKSASAQFIRRIPDPAQDYKTHCSAGPVPTCRPGETSRLSPGSRFPCRANKTTSHICLIVCNHPTIIRQ